MIDKERIDNLLNGYLDGELGPREHTEVKRLLLNDKSVSLRLKELEKYRQLMACLPQEEAPSFIMENIREKIKNTTPPPAIKYETHPSKEGFKQLVIRKVFAAAAMLILAAFLGGVIYSIVAPEKYAEKPMIVNSDTDTKLLNEENRPAGLSELPPVNYSFEATLEFNTKNRRSVTAYIQRTIAENKQVLLIEQIAEKKDSSFAITGSKQGLSTFLADLASQWVQLGEAWLYVENQHKKPKILVSNITPQQIDKIASGENSETIIAMAEDFALLNRMSAPVKKQGLVITNDEIELMPAPKPVLTSNPVMDKNTSASVEKEFLLTIVITGTE